MKKITFLFFVSMFAVNTVHAQTSGSYLRVNGLEGEIVTVQRGDTVNVSWSGLAANNTCYITSQLGPQNIHVDDVHFLGSNGVATFTADIPPLVTTTQPLDWKSGEWFIIYLLCAPYFSLSEPVDVASVIVYDEVNKIEVTSPKESANLVVGRKVDIKWKSDKKKVKKVSLLLWPSEPHIVKGNEILDEREWLRRTLYLSEESKNRNKFSWKVPKNTQPGVYTLTIGEIGGQGKGEVLVNIVSPKSK
jgi:hypothetical protein